MARECNIPFSGDMASHITDLETIYRATYEIHGERLPLIEMQALPRHSSHLTKGGHSEKADSQNVNNGLRFAGSTRVRES